MEEKETLAQRVKRLRESMGWTRKELAERAGIHPTHVGLIERAGRVGVRPETLEKLAGAFGITSARLLGEEESGPADLEPYRMAIKAAMASGLEPDDLLRLINTMAGMFKKQ
ncbi:MAG TPA: helix-turn-helix transcriptional regulator [Symbiobacteriaceae bacterium]|nr:helix-turn-helix transcriptional regulator [Symbiobacteriaceae bacterium]